jgi:hypothetical protein
MRLTPPSEPSANAFCSIPCGKTYESFTFGCNSIGTHTVYGYYSDKHTNGYKIVGSATVTVTAPPPVYCPQFVLIASPPRVLTHKYGDAFNSEYLPGQTADGEMSMKIKTVAAPAGTTVYLRLTDPPDDSPYGTPHQKDDNVDTGAGSFGSSMSRFSSVSLPANGSVPFTVRTSLQKGGDNYQVEASADPALHTPSYECSGTMICQKTKLTTWKRFYVEPNEMYRESQLIQANILVGERLVYVNDRGFGRNDPVRLIHAPSYLRSELGDSQGFYFEDFTIVNVRRNRNPAIAATFEIELDQPVTRHYRREAPIAGVPMGDALVNLAPHRMPGPTFQMNDQYMRNAFYFAYVDLVTIPGNGVGMPLYDAMNNTAMIFAGAKWFAARRSTTIPSNTGLAVAAGTREPLPAPPGGTAPLSLGTTAGVYSYVWRQNIDDGTRRNSGLLVSGLDPNLVSGEVLVHELAHQWNVNSTYPDNECDKMSYDNPALYCQNNGPRNSGQYADGHLAWHYVGTTPATADSEYMTIRKADEPKP